MFFANSRNLTGRVGFVATIFHIVWNPPRFWHLHMMWTWGGGEEHTAEIFSTATYVPWYTGGGKPHIFNTVSPRKSVSSSPISRAVSPSCQGREKRKKEKGGGEFSAWSLQKLCAKVTASDFLPYKKGWKCSKSLSFLIWPRKKWRGPGIHYNGKNKTFVPFFIYISRWNEREKVPILHTSRPQKTTKEVQIHTDIIGPFLAFAPPPPRVLSFPFFSVREKRRTWYVCLRSSPFFYLFLPLLFPTSYSDWP